MAITLEDDPSFCSRGEQLAAQGSQIIGVGFTWDSSDILFVYGPNEKAPNCGETSVYWLSSEYRLIQKIPVSSITPSTPSPYQIFRSNNNHIDQVSLHTAVMETINRVKCSPGELMCDCEGIEPYAPYPNVCISDFGGLGNSYDTQYSRQSECKTICAANGIKSTPDPIVEVMMVTAENTGIPITYAQAVEIVSNTGSTVDDYQKDMSYSTTDIPLVIPESGAGAMPCVSCSSSRSEPIYNYGSAVLSYGPTAELPYATDGTGAAPQENPEELYAIRSGITYTANPENPTESYISDSSHGPSIIQPLPQMITTSAATNTADQSKYLMYGAMALVVGSLAYWIVASRR